MGGMTTASFLINNPALNVSGVIFSAPFFGFNDAKGINDFKKLQIKSLGPHLGVSLRC